MYRKFTVTILIYMIDNITVSRLDSVGMRLVSVTCIRLTTDNLYYVNFGMNID